MIRFTLNKTTILTIKKVMNVPKLLPIRNIFVLHSGQVPFVAGLPFLRVTAVAP